MAKVWIATAAALGLAAGCDSGHDPSSHKHSSPTVSPPEAADPNVKAYPLKTCVVSGEPLGAMGKPARLVHERQEFLLCCSGCEKDFKKDPAKYMAKVAEAQKK